MFSVFKNEHLQLLLILQAICCLYAVYKNTANTTLHLLRSPMTNIPVLLVQAIFWNQAV